MTIIRILIEKKKKLHRRRSILRSRTSTLAQYALFLTRICTIYSASSEFVYFWSYRWLPTHPKSGGYSFAYRGFCTLNYYCRLKFIAVNRAFKGICYGLLEYVRFSLFFTENPAPNINFVDGFWWKTWSSQCDATGCF